MGCRLLPRYRRDWTQSPGQSGCGRTVVSPISDDERKLIPRRRSHRRRGNSENGETGPSPSDLRHVGFFCPLTTAVRRRTEREANTPLFWSLSLIHISEPTRLGMISYAVFCLKKKKK